MRRFTRISEPKPQPAKNSKKSRIAAMTTPPLFPGFDGLMTLSRREGVDIRPTLLRVLTDLYVQASAHSAVEQRQFVELTSRLIDQVDDATRAAVRARLAIYPGAPPEILAKLGLKPAQSGKAAPLDPEPSSLSPIPEPAASPIEARDRPEYRLSMQPKEAAEIHDMFLRADTGERAAILHSLAGAPLKASPKIPLARAARAVEILEMAAFVGDVENFVLELGDSLILPARVAAHIVDDVGGEPLACAARALNMPSPVFQRVLLFLKPELGASVHAVYRLSRLYDRLSEHVALVMLAAWRGSTLATTRAKYRPALFDDERSRARSTPSQGRPSAQPGAAPAPRAGTQSTRR
jgi:hypothetical protein